MRAVFYRMVAFGRWLRFRLFSAYPAKLFDASFGAAWDAVMVAQSGCRVRRHLSRGDGFSEAFKTWPLVLAMERPSLLDMARALEGAVEMAQMRSLEGVTLFADATKLVEFQAPLVALAQLSPIPVDVRLYQDGRALEDAVDRVGGVVDANALSDRDIPLAARLRVGRSDRNAARETLKRLGLMQAFVAVAFPTDGDPAAGVIREVVDRAAGELPHVSFLLLFADNVALDLRDSLARNPRVILAPLLGGSFLQNCGLLSECDAFLGGACFYAHLARTHDVPCLVLDGGGAASEDVVRWLSEKLPRRSFRYS